MTPRSPAAPATMALCLATVATYLIQVMVSGDVIEQAFGLIPVRIYRPSSVGRAIRAWSTLFTYIFPHGGWWHVAMNMAGLCFFGRLAEPIMGSMRFLATYLASGVFTGLVIASLGPHWTTPAFGASGAISGLLGAFMAISLPRRSIPSRRNVAFLCVEGLSIIGVALWFLIRTPPEIPDRMSAFMWHFIPFLAAWTAVRCRRQVDVMRKAC